MIEIDQETDVESSIADYAASFSLDDVPSDVLEKARLVLLDTIGVCIRGSEADYVAAYGERLAEFSGGGDSTVFGTRSGGSVLAATQANAAGGTTLELDEGNQRSAHMGIHTVPAALAVAEQVGASGRDLLEAVVLAYEVSARLGSVVRPMKSGLHPHGAWAPVGAAIATASLVDFDAAEYREAIRIAVNPFVAGHWAASLEGATVRNYYTGASCVLGVKAALLAESGTTGVHDAMYRCLLPYTAGNDVDHDSLVDRYATLGEEYFLEDSYFKMHAACRYSHAPVEAFERLAEEHDLEPDDVERIIVRTFKDGTLLAGTNPENVLSAKFSTPFVLAARLVLGTSGVDAFTEETIARDDVRAVASRVEVDLDEEYDERAAAGRWGAEVEVTTTDGSSVSASVPDARGGGDSPFTHEEVLGKFDDLVVNVTSSETATDLREDILDVDSVTDVSTLFSPLR